MTLPELSNNINMKPDFFYKTGELKDETVYSCWLIKTLKTPGVSDVSAALVKISPNFYYDKSISEVILATSPTNGFCFSEPKFPEWVTVYKFLKKETVGDTVYRRDTEIVDKGYIYKALE